MTLAAKQETLGFQAEIKQLLDLMTRALYSNREIFLRELISNASDAADKLRFAALSDDSLYEGEAELQIRVEYNKAQRTIVILDNGIGMSRQEVVENLGTLAKSGTRQFFESLSGDAKQDSRLIGQFGVGFYAAFVVADQVEVLSRRAGLSRTEGVRWVSSGESDFSVETVNRPKRGTKVILHLREGMDEFLHGARLRGVIRKYSDHIALPIIMPGEGEDAPGEETVNSAQAIWRRNKKELSEQEYREFYKHITHDPADPLAWTHNRVEGKLEYASILFIPSHAPFDLWDREQKHGVKLYVRRIFIMDDAEQLLPVWLRFVRGVVDCDDLPLNISREILQQNTVISALRTGCTMKILGLLSELAKKEPARYLDFWRQFGRVLKEGVMDTGDHKDTLFGLLRFASTYSETEDQDVSLADYVARMTAQQKAIYYITADSYAAACNSPHLEIFRKKGMEVLLLSDPIDEWLSTRLTDYEGKSFVSVSKGALSFDEPEDGTEATADSKANGGSTATDTAVTPACQDALLRMSEVLKEQVRTVRETVRLTDSPVCLVVGEHEVGRRMEQILKAAGQPVSASKPSLEVNPSHPIILHVFAEKDPDRFAEWCHILCDQALLSEGSLPRDPLDFVKRLNRLLLSQSAQGTVVAED